jgi:hypothetical protein
MSRLSHPTFSPANQPEPPSLTGARVANALAEAIPAGTDAVHKVARSFTEREIALGLSFLGTILEIAAASSKALAVVRHEREALTGG